MIFRKPYAFLVKNFRKIHIFMLFLCAYIFYKNSQTRLFVTEFLNFGTYDMYNEPISRHINIFVILALLIVIALFITLVVLLKRKNKPWKLYLIPVVVYVFMFIVFIITTNFFATYLGDGTTGVRAVRDLLLISSLGQYPVFIILLIRIFGIDINNFNFKMDQEYLELDSDDRDEFEININVDKHSFISGYKKFKRNAGYVYEEHKYLIRTTISAFLIIVIGYTIYNVFIVHRSFKQGSSFDIDGYTVIVNNSYYTDKDYKGDIISDSSNFVIVDLSIKNNALKRKLDLSRYHIMNGIKNYGYTVRTYGTDFDDLGETSNSKDIKQDEKVDLILVFKVDKKLDKNGFVLGYQEYINGEPFIRKIKLNIEDVSKIIEKNNIKIGKKTNIQEGSKKKDLNVESIDIVDSAEYSYEECDDEDSCASEVGTINVNSTEKIVEIEFLSDVFEGKDFIDFSSKYGKIYYIDNNKTRSVKVKDAVGRKYMGQYIYFKVPSEVLNAEKVNLVYVVRNRQYTLKIK